MAKQIACCIVNNESLKYNHLHTDGSCCLSVEITAADYHSEFTLLHHDI